MNSPARNHTEEPLTKFIFGRRKTLVGTVGSRPYRSMQISRKRQLRFDRMVIEPDTVIPIDARVVDAPGYRVDNQGRILGRGLATRDIVTWSIPILRPIVLLMLPMRGPRPALKEETRLTLKVMDDMAVPSTTQPQPDPTA